MTRILLIDNYDSFTYNLAHLVGGVTGTLPRVARNDEIDLEGIRAWSPDAIILSPGPGHPGCPGDVGICAELVRSGDIPLLGVCLGHQLLVHEEGGHIGRIEPMHGRQSAVFHDGEGIFAGFQQGFAAVRYHSLAVLGDLPRDLMRTAWTQDGVVMGVKHARKRIWGVQFHPESICSELGSRLIANFLRENGISNTPAAAMPSQARESRGPVARRRVEIRDLPGFPDAEQIFAALYGKAETAFWLDSSKAEKGLARFSFMGAPRPGSVSLSYDVNSRTTTFRRKDQPDHQDTADILDVLESVLGEVTVPPVPDLPFVGGYVGYFGYEMKADLGSPNRHISALPDAQWMLIEQFLAFDHEKRTIHAVGLIGGDHQQQAFDEWVRAIEITLGSLPLLPTIDGPAAVGQGDVTPDFDHDEDEYLTAIHACLEKLRAGESYELCLTTRAQLPVLPSPFDYYRILRRLSPAPYAAYLRFDETIILCSSPERFLAVTADGRVSSKPIKGTAARMRDPVEDAAARDRLHDCTKNRAENLMIVDLVRNDLGRVCTLGSVTVSKLMAIESYATVHQMVSTVEGQLAPGRTALDAVRACFPGGSMTGAPKLRSMEILDQLERSARGIYSGSIGYLSADGGADLNIVIRSMVSTPRETTLGVGGAIVILSDPAEEYAEILLKAKALLRAYSAATQRSEATPIRRTSTCDHPVGSMAL